MDFIIQTQMASTKFEKKWSFVFDANSAFSNSIKAHTFDKSSGCLTESWWTSAGSGFPVSQNKLELCQRLDVFT